MKNKQTALKRALISHSFDLVSSDLNTNWMHCDRSQPRRIGSCAVKRLSSPWLRPMTAHLLSSDELRLDEGWAFVQTLRPPARGMIAASTGWAKK